MTPNLHRASPRSAPAAFVAIVLVVTVVPAPQAQAARIEWDSSSCCEQNCCDPSDTGCTYQSSCKLWDDILCWKPNDDNVRQVPSVNDEAIVEASADCVILVRNSVQIDVVRFLGRNNIELKHPRKDLQPVEFRVGAIFVDGFDLSSNVAAFTVNAAFLTVIVEREISIEAGIWIWRGNKLYCSNSGSECSQAPSCRMTVRGQASFIAHDDTKDKTLCLDVKVQAGGALYIGSETPASGSSGPGFFLIGGVLENFGSLIVSDIKQKYLNSGYSRWINQPGAKLDFKDWTPENSCATAYPPNLESGEISRWIQKHCEMRNLATIRLNFPLDNAGTLSVSTPMVEIMNGGSGSGEFRVRESRTLDIYGRYDFTTDSKFAGIAGAADYAMDAESDAQGQYKANTYPGQGCGAYRFGTAASTCGQIQFFQAPTGDIGDPETENFARLAGSCQGGVQFKVSANIVFNAPLTMQRCCGMDVISSSNFVTLEGRKTKTGSEDRDVDIIIGAYLYVNKSTDQFRATIRNLMIRNYGKLLLSGVEAQSSQNESNAVAGFKPSTVVYNKKNDCSSRNNRDTNFPLSYCERRAVISEVVLDPLHNFKIVNDNVLELHDLILKPLPFRMGMSANNMDVCSQLSVQNFGVLSVFDRRAMQLHIGRASWNDTSAREYGPCIESKAISSTMTVSRRGTNQKFLVTKLATSSKIELTSTYGILAWALFTANDIAGTTTEPMLSAWNLNISVPPDAAPVRVVLELSDTGNIICGALCTFCKDVTVRGNWQVNGDGALLVDQSSTFRLSKPDDRTAVSLLSNIKLIVLGKFYLCAATGSTSARGYVKFSAVYINSTEAELHFCDSVKNGADVQQGTVEGDIHVLKGRLKGTGRVVGNVDLAASATADLTTSQELATNMDVTGTFTAQEGSILRFSARLKNINNTGPGLSAMVSSIFAQTSMRLYGRIVVEWIWIGSNEIQIADAPSPITLAHSVNLMGSWQLQRRDIRGGVVGRVRSYVPSSGGRNSEF